MKRKGSMQLSIEAIIILVIAFTLLGFGIVFVKNVFSQGGSQVDDYLTTKTCTTASSEYPLTPDNFNVDKGGSQQTQICVYNNALTDLVGVRPFLDGCTPPPNSATPGFTQSPPITLDAAPLDVKRNKGAEFKPTFTATAQAEIGTYICNIYAQKFDKTGEKIGPIQVTVEVQ